MSNNTGGGLFHYESNLMANPSLIYGEGLRVPRSFASLELDSLVATGTFGKKKSYDRVRNNNNNNIGCDFPYKIKCYSIYYFSRIIRWIQEKRRREIFN